MPDLRDFFHLPLRVTRNEVSRVRWIRRRVGQPVKMFCQGIPPLCGFNLLEAVVNGASFIGEIYEGKFLWRFSFFFFPYGESFYFEWKFRNFSFFFFFWMLDVFIALNDWSFRIIDFGEEEDVMKCATRSISKDGSQLISSSKLFLYEK